MMKMFRLVFFRHTGFLVEAGHLLGQARNSQDTREHLLSQTAAPGRAVFHLSQDACLRILISALVLSTRQIASPWLSVAHSQHTAVGRQ